MTKANLSPWNPLTRYTHWLHTMWPAGDVEKLPRVGPDGSTNVPGLYITGDLTGIPLLKFSANTGARAVQAILNDPAFQRDRQNDLLDLVIIGGGVSGMAAALEARKAGLRFEILEATEPFSTVINFPARKPIYTYPTEMTPAGNLQFRADIKEALVDELRAQTRGIPVRQVRVERILRRGNALAVELERRPGASSRVIEYASSTSGNALLARRVIVAIGRSGNFRKLNVPGEDLDKVYNRLHDPKDFADQRALVVGGGDSALETAIALAECGAHVTLSYRKPEFSRPKPENIDRLDRLLHDPAAHVQVEEPISERVTTAVGDFMENYLHPGSIDLMMASQVKEIREHDVVLANSAGQSRTIGNDVVFTMIGREPPLDFLRRSGVKIKGDWRISSVISLVLVLAFCIFLYHWKKTGVMIADIPGLQQISRIGNTFADHKWFPYNVPAWWNSLGDAFQRPTNLLGILHISLGEPGFYYSVLYSAAIVFFGIARIRRRKTPYVKWQTLTLMAIQVIPLFLLPYLLLPWMGNNGWFDAGIGKTIADALFPLADYGHGREYWRAFGLILAWPLFIWNVFTSEPMWTWLAISFTQTFIFIPLIIYFWGKGAYCGWICSCGALAETLGDAHREKMPHGPGWNRFNMLGQTFLFFAMGLLALRILGWTLGNDSWAGQSFTYLFRDIPVINYTWFVDLLWAGILGAGLYWHFSGRVWCRFACPLAALMHIYARFSRFRILADKKKCISCNICTSVCHQGIDIMNFANKGLPMADPQCVRCSACVQSCPTGVLYFGQVNRKTGATIKTDPDWLGASPVRMVEVHVNGKPLK